MKIQILISDIPKSLHNSDFYRNIDKSELFIEIDDKYYKYDIDDDITSTIDCIEKLVILNFWLADNLTLNFWKYIYNLTSENAQLIYTHVKDLSLTHVLTKIDFLEKFHEDNLLSIIIYNNLYELAKLVFYDFISYNDREKTIFCTNLKHLLDYNNDIEYNKILNFSMNYHISKNGYVINDEIENVDITYIDNIIKTFEKDNVEQCKYVLYKFKFDNDNFYTLINKAVQFNAIKCLKYIHYSYNNNIFANVGYKKIKNRYCFVNNDCIFYDDNEKVDGFAHYIVNLNTEKTIKQYENLLYAQGINIKQYNSIELCCHAAKVGNFECLKFLIDTGYILTDIALKNAIIENHTECVEYIKQYINKFQSR